MSSSFLNSANLPANRSRSGFDHTVFNACRKLFHFRPSRCRGTFSLIRCWYNSSEIDSVSLHILWSWRSSGSVACVRTEVSPIFSVNSRRRTVTVSASAFSRRAPSEDLYRYFPFEMILLAKSTTCKTEAATDNAERGSRGMMERSTGVHWTTRTTC